MSVCTGPGVCVLAAEKRSQGPLRPQVQNPFFSTGRLALIHPQKAPCGEGVKNLTAAAWVSVEARVRSQAQCSGFRIRHCCRCGPDSSPGPGTSTRSGCGPKTRTRKHPHGQKLSNADFGDIVVQKNGTETKNPWWPLCKRVTESQTGLPDQATHAAAGHRSPSASQQLRRLKRRRAAPRAQVPALRAEDPPSPPRPLCRHSPIYGRLKNTG